MPYFFHYFQFFRTLERTFSSSVDSHNSFSQTEKEYHVLLAFGTPRRALSQRSKIKKKKFIFRADTTEICVVMSSTNEVLPLMVGRCAGRKVKERKKLREQLLLPSPCTHRRRHRWRCMSWRRLLGLCWQHETTFCSLPPERKDNGRNKFKKRGN